MSSQVHRGRTRRYRGSSSRPNFKRNYGNGGRRNGRFRSTISSDKYINREVEALEITNYTIKHQFADLGLNPRLEQNLLAKGYAEPTAIQDQAIGPVLAGRDIVGLANTGTGKTAAFILPAIHLMLKTKRYNHTLIITPTRELATQVEDEFRLLARGLGLYSVVCVGGVNMGKQIRELKRGVNLIIGTPGRLKDLAERKLLDLSAVEVLVLDEADQMLDMGFLPDMKHLIGLTPVNRQVLCFSATMDARVAGLIDGIQNDPITISVLAKQTAKHIHQDIVKVTTKEQKLDQLVELIDSDDFAKVLVFGETKWGVQRLADALSQRGYPAESIHGNKSQSQRQRSLNNFKADKARVLVATDVAARGLDIPNVDLVVNYDQPNNHDTYIHRIGRTGRAGKGGHARTFI